jgi:hypothetical protein
VAGNPGRAKLTVKAGSKNAAVAVTVGESARAGQAGVVGRAKPAVARKAQVLHHAALAAPMPQQGQSQGFGARLPDSEASSLYWAQNDVGAPSGRTEPGAAMPAAATGGTETSLSSNFSFGVPLVNLGCTQSRLPRPLFGQSFPDFPT